MARAASWPADWAERIKGKGCSMCAEGRPEERNLSARIHSGLHSDAYLQRRADFRPGYTVVIFRGRHAAEPTELSDLEWAGYSREVLGVGKALEAHYRPAKVNYMILGNAVPHLHTHVVPRPLDDPEAGSPLSFPPPTDRPPQLPEEAFQRDVASLRRLLGYWPPGTMR